MMRRRLAAVFRPGQTGPARFLLKSTITAEVPDGAGCRHGRPIATSSLMLRSKWAHGRLSVIDKSNAWAFQRQRSKARWLHAACPCERGSSVRWRKQNCSDSRATRSEAKGQEVVNDLEKPCLWQAVAA